MSTPPQRPSVLVIDDDPDIRRMLVMLLTFHGYQVDAVIDVESTLQHLRHAQTLPNLILMDFSLLDMDGRELKAAIHAVGTWRTIPIVLITANAKACALGTDLDVTACLPKPFAPQELLDVIRQILADHSAGA